MSARVSWISLTPVKALALEQVEQVELREDGLRGDRRFYLVDENDRLVNDTGKNGPLQTVHGLYDEEADVLSMRLPDGTEVRAEVERGAELTTIFHGHPLPARLAPGPWDAALSDLIGKELRLVAPAYGAADRGRSGAASLLGTASLHALAGVLGVDEVDARRFRMSFGVEGIAAHEEDSWIGRRVQIGAAVVVPQGHIGRCVITTQDPATGRTDLDTLKALAAYRGELETTEPLPFGIYAAVAEPGLVRLGDAVAVL
ncbi:MAG: MOSC domain-containing protein [Actinobacteria bacterium]|nr:MOSC domain-containing protein [Actinomycetota bacterium]